MAKEEIIERIEKIKKLVDWVEMHPSSADFVNIRREIKKLKEEILSSEK